MQMSVSYLKRTKTTMTVFKRWIFFWQASGVQNEIKHFAGFL